MEMDPPAGLRMPYAGALLDRVHRRQRLHAELGIDPAARQVVEDVDVVAGIRQMQARRPAHETVTAQKMRVAGYPRIEAKSTDSTTPTLLINAVPDPMVVSHLVRETVERCRAARGVRAFDF